MRFLLAKVDLDPAILMMSMLHRTGIWKKPGLSSRASEIDLIGLKPAVYKDD
jgi:hypothetical protein